MLHVASSRFCVLAVCAALTLAIVCVLLIQADSNSAKLLDLEHQINALHDKAAAAGMAGKGDDKSMRAVNNFDSSSAQRNWWPALGAIDHASVESKHTFIYFVHMPKAGGSSLLSLFRKYRCVFVFFLNQKPS